MVRALLAATALAVIALAGCGGSDPAPASQADAPGRVAELTRVESLRTAFARDEGHARLLLLLAPT
jgi:hypothetical protein